MPSARRRSGASAAMSPAPSSTMRPASGGRRPISASISSPCPLPPMPARPTISPARTWRSRPGTATWPSGRTHRSPCRASRTAPGSRRGRGTGGGEAPTTRCVSSAPVIPRGSRVATVRPPRITVTRSANAVTSRSLCVTSTTAAPDAANRRMVASNRPPSPSVGTAVGSSRIRMLAPPTNAFRISTRCCSATERLSTVRRGSMGRPRAMARSAIPASVRFSPDRKAPRGTAGSFGRQESVRRSIRNGQALIGLLAGLPVLSALGGIYRGIGSRGAGRVSAPPCAMVPCRRPFSLNRRRWAWVGTSARGSRGAAWPAPGQRPSDLRRAQARPFRGTLPAALHDGGRPRAQRPLGRASSREDLPAAAKLRSSIDCAVEELGC